MDGSRSVDATTVSEGCDDESASLTVCVVVVTMSKLTCFRLGVHFMNWCVGSSLRLATLQPSTPLMCKSSCTKFRARRQRSSVVLILDMCQLVPMKRPSANRVLERLAEIQQLLPPVDLSEATENHGQSSNPPATSAAILAKTPEQDDETSSSSSVDDSSSAVPTESGDVFLKLQRALSDQSNFETGSNGSAGGHFDVAQTIRRFSVTLKTAAGDMCVDPCWCSVTSSVKPRARKLFVGF
jgi:hypothetical protein